MGQWGFQGSGLSAWVLLSSITPGFVHWGRQGQAASLLSTPELPNPDLLSTPRLPGPPAPPLPPIKAVKQKHIEDMENDFILSYAK